MKNNKNFSPFIEGERIYLRKVQISDVNENYYDWINNPIINQYLESRFYPTSIELIQSYVKKMRESKDNIFLAIIKKDNKQHIGNIKIGPINWFHKLGDIGIIIGEKDCWGKGYATEAIKLLIAYAFDTLNLHKITAGCYDINQGSLKAFKKSGFEIEGIRKQHNFYKGQYVDAIMLGLINKFQPD